MRAFLTVCLSLMAAATLHTRVAALDVPAKPDGAIRFATYNVSLHGERAGEIAQRLSEPGDAKAALPDALAEIKSDGSTPLTQAVTIARSLLEDEAAAARSFGTYRMIVTTDGQADDGKALEAVVADMAAATPIQLATIGIDIRGRHVLRREDLGSFVDVSNIAALRGALEAAVAENSDFAAITEFAEEG